MKSARDQAGAMKTKKIVASSESKINEDGLFPVTGLKLLVLDHNGDILAGQALMEFLRQKREETSRALTGILNRMAVLREHLAVTGGLDKATLEELRDLDARRLPFHLKHRIYDAYLRAIEQEAGTR